MLRSRRYDMRNLVDSGLTKPRELLEWQKDFFIGQQ